MKKIIPPIAVLLLYCAFLLFCISPSGAGHHPTGMYDVVIGHLTDYPIKEAVINQNDFIIVKLQKSVNNTIAHLNTTVLKDKFLGIFDMRITKWVCMMFLSLIVCVLIFIPLSYKIRNAKDGSKSRWVNMWEVLIGFIHDDIIEPYFDHKYLRTAMPYFGTVFFFILFCNLLGMIPGFSTATGNLAVTGGMALFTLFGMIVVGTVKQGPFWIFAGIVPHGLPFLMYLLLWPIEVAGLVIKPFALTVRLFANMTAGHVVIIIFVFLVMMYQNYFVGIGSVVGSLMIYLLELLVAFIQAYIFTTLSAMFIGSSLHAH